MRAGAGLRERKISRSFPYTRAPHTLHPRQQSIAKWVFPSRLKLSSSYQI
ncbi:MAG: hypothetical protein F6J93_13310 [Oscillatoria sp. SIO1A7]|nr:hypothetical protein [Oscillatoria sp. SIO1A7]